MNEIIQVRNNCSSNYGGGIVYFGMLQFVRNERSEHADAKAFDRADLCRLNSDSYADAYARANTYARTDAGPYSDCIRNW